MTTKQAFMLKISLLVFLTIASSIFIYAFPPIPQDLIYHAFADNRCLCHLNNFMNVTSNAPFILFGIWGLIYVRKNKPSKKVFANKIEPTVWTVFFLGAILIGFGSGYYHIAPDNDTLVWDRLPMTLSFMALFTAVIIERLSPFLGKLLFPIFLCLGAFSIFYWNYTESLEQGDLRLYILVQFFPVLAIPFLCSLFPPLYPGFKYIGLTLVSYFLAKLCEYFDYQIYEVFQGALSGHTLKHLFASLAILWMIFYLKKKS